MQYTQIYTKIHTYLIGDMYESLYKFIIIFKSILRIVNDILKILIIVSFESILQLLFNFSLWYDWFEYS